MKKLSIYGYGIILLCLCFTACGQKQEQVIDESFSYLEDIMEEEEDDFDRTGLTWENFQWVNPLMTDSKKKLYVEKYQMCQWIYPKSERVDKVICGNTYYRLEKVEVEDDFDYFIEGFDVDKGTNLVFPLDKDALLNGNVNSELEDLYVKSENEFILLMETVEDAKVTELEAIHIDGAGKVLKRVNLYGAFVTSNVRDVTDLDWWGRMGIHIESMDVNHYYLTSHFYTPIVIVDADGSFVAVMNTATKESQDEITQYIRSSNITVEEQSIFWCTEGVKSIWYTYNEETGIRQLAQNDNYSMHGGFVLSEDGYCFVIADNWLVRWDIFTGKAIKMLNFVNEGISENLSHLEISLQESGCPILYNDKGDYLETYTLSYHKPDISNYMTVVSFSNNCKELETACADYTRKNPADGIWVEKPSGDLDTYRTRLLAEMAAGRGPDAMYISPADMQIFYEKGLLEDVTGYLTPELEKQVFKGVLDCGKIDGRQIGYPLAANLSSMLVDKNLWKKESWNLQDILDLINSGKIPNMEMILLLDTDGWKGDRMSEGVLQALVLQDLNNTQFLNLKEGICKFDSPEFIRVLELCKQYPKTMCVGMDARNEYEKGTLVGYVGDVKTLQKFSYTMYGSGETLKCVGFPSQEGYGSYWDCDYLLVVRKDCGKRETILNLMESLYDVNNQRKVQNPVNRKAYEYIKTCQVLSEETGAYENWYGLNAGDGRFSIFPPKKDGSSWLQEYLDLADKAAPLPHDADMAAQIVREEVTAYFNGSKDAESVAKIIQNRVKLWMMEQM